MPLDVDYAPLNQRELETLTSMIEDVDFELDLAPREGPVEVISEAFGRVSSGIMSCLDSTNKPSCVSSVSGL